MLTPVSAPPPPRRAPESRAHYCSSDPVLGLLIAAGQHEDCGELFFAAVWHHRQHQEAR
jgi:hypothetical protein